MSKLEGTRQPAGKPVAVLSVALAVLAAMVLAFTDDAHQATLGVLFVLLLGLLVGTAMLVPWRRWPTQRADEAAALAHLPHEPAARSRALRSALRRVDVGASVVSLALAATIGVTPVGPTVVRWLGDLLGGSRTAQLVLGVAALTLAFQIVGLPFKAATHKVLRRGGLSEERWGAWTVTHLKGAGLGGVLNGLMLACIYTAIAASPDWWWLWSCVLLIVLAVAVTIVFPVLILPIFFKAEPLEVGELRDRLLAMAHRDGVGLKQIYVMDASRRTRSHNAAMAGFGPTRRLLLFDNPLKPAPAQPQPGPAATDKQAHKAMSEAVLPGATHDEIAVIAAHELAHAKFQDAVGGSFLGMLQLGIILCGIQLLNGWTWLLERPGVASITDPAAIGLLLALLSLGVALLRPYNALTSRRHEAYADWHALTITNDPAALVSSWHRIVEVNLIDPNPNRLIHALSARHPTVAARIAMARAYARTSDTKLSDSDGQDMAKRVEARS